jgi:hypothetical protein
MPEPSVAAGSIFGVKFASLIAGFAGGVVSLSYLRELSRGQMMLAVAAGSLTAGYITPGVLHYIAFPPELENGIAFLIGLTAMNVVPGFIALAERFKNSPESFIKGKDK